MDADLRQAIASVESAVREYGKGLVSIVVIWFLIDLYDLALYSKYRYALTNLVGPSVVQVQKKPHDCDFMAAPLGSKYCHYEPVVSVVKVGLRNGAPAISYDDGQGWGAFTPSAGETVPSTPEVRSVSVTWEKKSD